MMKSYKILKCQCLTVNVDEQPGLIHAVGFIMYIFQFSLGALVGGLVDTKNVASLKSLKSQF